MGISGGLGSLPSSPRTKTERRNQGRLRHPEQGAEKNSTQPRRPFRGVGQSAAFSLQGPADAGPGCSFVEGQKLDAHASIKLSSIAIGNLALPTSPGLSWYGSPVFLFGNATAISLATIDDRENLPHEIVLFMFRGYEAFARRAIDRIYRGFDLFESARPGDVLVVFHTPRPAIGTSFSGPLFSMRPVGSQPIAESRKCRKRWDLRCNPRSLAIPFSFSRVL